MVGLLNGLAFAVITGTVAYIWFKVPGLGFVIGLAMICNLAAAALGGILIPLALHRLKFDPAVASSPFVTTVTDVVGFFSFLSIASFWFGLRWGGTLPVRPTLKDRAVTLSFAAAQAAARPRGRKDRARRVRPGHRRRLPDGSWQLSG